MDPSRFTKIQIKPTRGFGSSGTVELTVDGSRQPLTDAATPLFDVACPPNTRAGGMILATIQASDGTDGQSMTTLVTYAAVNKAGTITVAFTDVGAQDAKVTTGASTLAVSWTATQTTQKFTVNITPNGSLTETVYDVTFFVEATIGDVTMRPS